MLTSPPIDRRQAACWAALWAAISIVVSIAAFNILLGLAILLLLISRQKWRLPPIVLPLSLFVLGTLISLALSPHPTQGLPQVRKFWVFLLLPVFYTAVRSTASLYHLLIGWTLSATAASLWSGVQFVRRVQEAHKLGRDFYTYYIAQRTTGFTGHWMTFGGTQMIVLLMLLAWLLFGPRKRSTPWLWGAALLLIASLLVSLDRGVWLACVVAGSYLIASWKPKVVLAIPVVLAAAFLFAPGVVKERMSSIFHPHGQVDSNSHRYYTLRTGIEMIKAHPVWGLGPEQVGPQFDAYMPPDLPRLKPDGFYGHLHNIYVQYAAERGIPTLLCLLWLIAVAGRDFWRAIPRVSHPSRAILYGAIAVIVAVLVEGLGEHNLGDSEVLICFLTVLAAGYIAREDTAAALPSSPGS